MFSIGGLSSKEAFSVQNYYIFLSYRKYGNGLQKFWHGQLSMKNVENSLT